MSRSGLPPESEPAVRELQALYREVAHEEPGPALDRRILDAARADVQGAAPARQPRHWWRGWLPLTSAIAVAAVGLSLTWRVMDQQERELREEIDAAAAADARAAKAAPAEAPGAAGSVLEAAQPLTTPVGGAEVGALRKSSPAVADSAPPTAAASVAAPAAPPAGETLTSGQRAEPDGVRERRDARLAAPAAPGAERQAGKLETKRLDGGRESAAEAFAPPAANSVAGAAARAMDPAADAPTPELWLQRIRDLRSAGRGAEAAQSLARFRARHPDIALPDDLRDLK